MLDLTNYSNFKIEAVIDEWIHSEIDRDLLKRRLIDGYSFPQLRDMIEDKYKMDYSDRHIRKRYDKAMCELNKHF